MSDASRKLQTETQLEALVDEIRQAIIFGRFRPRERLVEEDLTQRYGATRHLLRNAFAELERIGLLERRPNKGVTVRDFSLKEVQELYEVRAILQTAAAKRMPLPPRAEFIAHLRALNAEYKHWIEAGDRAESSRTNNTFHDDLLAECGNGYLNQAIMHYWVLTTPIHWYALGDKEHLVRSHQDHERIITAYEVGDLDRLARLCVDHMYPALDAYRRTNSGRDA